jgi:hypothetical protein
MLMTEAITTGDELRALASGRPDLCERAFAIAGILPPSGCFECGNQGFLSWILCDQSPRVRCAWDLLLAEIRFLEAMELE